MISDGDHKSDRGLFQEISDFWSAQLNNEIFLRDYPWISRGSKDYFDIILAARQRFIYYFADMITFLKTSPNTRLLEVGCGMGTDAFVFAREGFHVTGIDLASAHLELAKQLFSLYGLSGDFALGNAEELPFPSGRFGSAYSFGVLHHTPDTGMAIQEIYRVLEPGGRAVLMLYHRHSLNNLVHGVTGKGFENARQEAGKETADAPVTQRFSKSEVRRMCSAFRHTRICTEYAYGAGWGKVYQLTPKPVYDLLSKVLGWHLVIYLQK